MISKEQIKEILIDNVELYELSDYARFTVETRGYKFKTLSGWPVYKWELYDAGYRNSHLLVNGYYPILVYEA